MEVKVTATEAAGKALKFQVLKIIWVRRLGNFSSRMLCKLTHTQLDCGDMVIPVIQYLHYR